PCPRMLHGSVCGTVPGWGEDRCAGLRDDTSAPVLRGFSELFRHSTGTVKKGGKDQFQGTGWTAGVLWISLALSRIWSMTPARCKLSAQGMSGLSVCPAARQRATSSASYS